MNIYYKLDTLTLKCIFLSAKGTSVFYPCLGFNPLNAYYFTILKK